MSINKEVNIDQNEEQLELYGRCKFFDSAKGWGIIKGNDGNEYFVHVTNLIEPITNGHRVVFKLGYSKNKVGKLEAIKVKIDKLNINNQEHYGRGRNNNSK